MSATTLSTSFGGVSGVDLEAELAQPRTLDHDATEAASLERDAALLDAALQLRDAGSDPRSPGAAALVRDTQRSPDHSVELRGVGSRIGIHFDDGAEPGALAVERLDAQGVKLGELGGGPSAVTKPFG